MLKSLSHATKTVPSFATLMVGSNCEELGKCSDQQLTPHTNFTGPQEAPRSGETRYRMLGLAHCRHSLAPMPVTTRYTKDELGSAATTGSQLFPGENSCSESKWL